MKGWLRISCNEYGCYWLFAIQLVNPVCGHLADIYIFGIETVSSVTPNKAMKRTSLTVTFSACAEKPPAARRPLIAALGAMRVFRKDSQRPA